MTTRSLTPDFQVDSSLKGIPAHLGSIRSSEIGQYRLNVLGQQVEFPVALLKASALEHNQRWMKSFVEQTGVLLAPHGKTTMSPELMRMQIADGAWGMTAATSTHVRTYHTHGIRRILLANQLVGRTNIDGVLALLADDPSLDFYTLVDSAAGLRLLRDGLVHRPIGRPLQILLELGAQGGRTGLRTLKEAVTLAREISADPHFCLAGVECFEGIYSGRNPADDGSAAALVGELARLALTLKREGLFGLDQPLFTAGGSAYFVIVVQVADRELAEAGFQVVLRSGCYLTHDSKHYRLIHERLAIGSSSADKDGGLRPALEVWGCIQSRPEAGLALVNLGKRDISYDIDLPVALWRHRSGERGPTPLDESHVTKGLNDQHLFLEVPRQSSLAVGDLIGLGVSHPCTTFDKWKTLFVVDDDYEVQSIVQTCF